MEHSVYICRWSNSPDGFTLWTTTEPRVQASGNTYALAEERLLNAIQERGGAMHAVLEFNPPLPKTDWEAKFAQPELYLICGDDRFEVDEPRQAPFETEQQREARLTWMDRFFERPLCRKCEATTSTRSGEPLCLNYAPPRYDGAFSTFGGAHVEIVSSEFVSLLTPQERDKLSLRAVIRSAKARKFYEILGPGGPPFVGVTELPVKGWQCSQCQHSQWGYWIDGFAFHDFVASSYLSSDNLGIFTVGSHPNIHLCATGERWRELAGRKGVRGFVSRPLGVVKTHDFVLNPVLPTYEELMRGSV